MGPLRKSKERRDLYRIIGDPIGTRTQVTGLKTPCPRPLDDGAVKDYDREFVSPEGFEPSTASLKGNCSTIELWARVSSYFTRLAVIPQA